MGYLFLFLMGFGFSVAGGIMLITYLNFLPAGLSWMDYFLFIQSRIECYFFPAGMIMIIYALYKLPNDAC